MFIVNCKESTIGQVIANDKYASQGKPKHAEKGDVILVAKRRTDLKKGEKSIKHIMYYDRIEKDTEGVSLRLWENQWEYILYGYDGQSIPPFDIEDIETVKNTYRSRGSVFLYVEKEDEKAILEWLFKNDLSTEPDSIFPDELPENSNEYREGKKKIIAVNIHERDPRARRVCIEHYGVKCSICDFSFGKVYGDECKGMIHVHHLKMVSESDGEYIVDPVTDLRPVCPNCHMVLHSKKDGVYSIDKVRLMLNK